MSAITNQNAPGIVLQQPANSPGILHCLDTYFLDLGASLTATCRAFSFSDGEGVLEGIMRHLNAHASLYYGILNILRISAQIIVACAEKISGYSFFQFLQSSAFALSCSVIGLVSSIITWFQEGFAMIRQWNFLDLFHKDAWKGNPDAVAADLEAVIAEPQTRIENRLRPWFVEEHLQNEEIIELINSIRNGDADAVTQAETLLAKARYLAIKKVIVHWIGWISASIGIAALVLSLLAFPPLTVGAMIGASLAVFVIRYLAANGWMDNQEEGFSIRNCIPGFLQCSSVEERLRETTP